MNCNQIFDGDFMRQRIKALQAEKGVSDHKLSVELGRSHNYIHNIMAGKALPSWSEFIAICNYFNVKLKDFFDDGVENPALLSEVLEIVYTLDEEHLRALLLILKNGN
jgi:transcriptional regulator with XRE-family HTH domain